MKINNIIIQKGGYENGNEINLNVSPENQQHRKRLEEMGVSSELLRAWLVFLLAGLITAARVPESLIQCPPSGHG